MKKLWNEHIKQKLTFIIVFLLLFNFIMPTYSQAGFGGKLMTPIKQFVVGVADVGMWLINYAFTGKVLVTVVYGPDAGFDNKNKLTQKAYEGDRWDDAFDNNLDWPNFNITLEEILANKLPALDVNILEPVDTTNFDDKLTNQDTQNALVNLRNTVSKWYIALRNIAIVGLLCILVYIGIRMIISSTSTEKAKYKQLIWNWLVAMCLVFVLHYIMAFTMFLVDKVNDVLVGTGEKKIQLMVNSETGAEDVVSLEDSEDGPKVTNYVNNFAEYARFYTSLKDWQGISFAIVYVVLVVYTIWFVIIYIKRFIYMMFLTLMAPMVAFSYPLDKLGDGKAQAFDMWFKEYVFNALIQPFHLLIYTVFVGMALDFARSNLIYTCVAIGFIIPAEKTLRKMFKMDRATATGTLGGFAGGAMASTLINKLASGKSKSGGNGAKDGSGGKAEIPTKSPDEGAILGAGNANNMTSDEFEAQGQNRQGGDNNSNILGPDGQPIGGNTTETPTILGADGQPISSASQDNGEINPNWERSADGNGWVDTNESRRLPNSPNSGRPIRQMSSSSSNSNEKRRVRDGFKNIGYKRFVRPITKGKGWKGAAGTLGRGLGKAAKTGAGLLAGYGVGAAAGIAALATGQDASAVLQATVGGAAAGYAGGSRIAGNIGSGARSIGSTVKNDYLEGRYGAEYVRVENARKQYKDNEQKADWIQEKFTNSDGTPLSRQQIDEKLDQSFELERMGITDDKDREKAMKIVEREIREAEERIDAAEARGELQGKDIKEMKRQARGTAIDKMGVVHKMAAQNKEQDFNDPKKMQQIATAVEKKAGMMNSSISKEQIHANTEGLMKNMFEYKGKADPRTPSQNNNS